MRIALYSVIFQVFSWLAHFIQSSRAENWLTTSFFWLQSLAWKSGIQLDVTGFAVIFYAVFWLVRIRGCFRRWRQPLLRGPEWFFSVHVRPGFYDGPGRRILHRYWMRMFIPFALDIPAAIAIFITGRILLLNWLIMALCAIIHINHVFSVDLAERQARHFAVAETERPVTSVTLSLQPRRLRDYTNSRFEWAIAVPSLLALAWLVGYYFSAPAHHSLRLVFFLPLYCLYMQLGMLYVKRLILAWRTPAPQSQAAEFLEAREKARKFYLLQCDLCRAMVTVQLVLWPFLMNSSEAARDGIIRNWFSAILLFALISGVWVEIKRKQLVKLSLRARSARLPDFLGEREIARWPVCYQPSAPMLMLRGAYGYSLNLANSLAYIGAAYLAGFIALFTLVHSGL